MRLTRRDPECQRPRSLDISATAALGDRGHDMVTKLLADATVNSLAQQVSMAIVPGVLLDHVD